MASFWSVPGVCTAALALALSSGSASADEVHRFAREDVLGTSFELKVHAKSREAAASIEGRILKEIDRLAKVMSTYDPESEVSKLNARPVESGEAIELSRELRDVLIEAESVGRASRGAFNAYLGESIALWRQAAKDNRLPDSSAVAEAASRARAGFRMRRQNRRRVLSRQAAGRFQLDAIAKGAMMDRAVRAALRSFPDCPGLLLDIGGELLAYGEVSWEVGIANPRRAEDNAPPLARVALRNLAIATSGAYARGMTIEGKEYSPIIDPRTGAPAVGVRSATVICGRASTADALATALCIMTPEEGLAMIEQRSEAVCLIVDERGAVHRSRGFQALESGAASAREPSGAWPDKERVVVEFELRNSDTAGGSSGRRRRFKRHFVAVWVEDAAGRRVRLLAIWAQRGEEKYIRDLNDFWKHGWVLSGEGDDPLKIRSVSRATRKPGRYRLAWDGRDDAGKSMPPGRYTIRIDVNREHGPPNGRERHTTAAVVIDCGGKPASARGVDQPELGGVKVRYGPAKKAKYF